MLKIIKNKIKIGSNVKIKFIKDRPGHDFRYALNSQKIKKNLKWSAKKNLISGLKDTINWYLNNNSYYKNLSKKDIVKRLGIKK